MRNYYLFISFLCMFCLALITATFVSIGTPISQKEIKLDQTRISDFGQIQSSINNYFQQKYSLPTNLATLQKFDKYVNVNDPQTNKGYDYTIISYTSYKLCATFLHDSKDIPDLYSPAPGNPQNTHKKGYGCIDYTVPDYLMPRPTPTPFIQTIEDSHIDTVTTNAKAVTYSNFPYGFFNQSINDWGLINYSNSSVSVTIKFKNPEVITGITNRFTHCPDKDCYTWNAKGITPDGKEITLLDDTIAQSDVDSPQNITISEKISQLTIAVQRNSGGSGNYIHWQKIKLQYQ